MNVLEKLVNNTDDFFDFKETEKIKFFAWYLDVYEGKKRFNSNEILNCYEQLNIQKPSNAKAFINSLANKRNPELLKDNSGFFLEKRIKDAFDLKFGKKASTVLVDKILEEIPNKLSLNAQKVFLEETINCFEIKAFRAVIVMTWNLTYDHIINHILNDSSRLSKFNIQLPKSYPKAKIDKINSRDEFSEFKESEILMVCKSSGLISSDIYKILKEKLDKRNSAAHPSTITFYQNTAEEYIIDLVNNVILKLI